MPKYKISTTCEIEVEAENHQKALSEAKNTNFDYWTQNIGKCQVAEIDDSDEIRLFCHICEKDFSFEEGRNGCDADFGYIDETEKWAVFAGYGSKHDMEDLEVVGEIGGEPYIGKVICDDCIDLGIAGGTIIKAPEPDYGDFDDYGEMGDIPF